MPLQIMSKQILTTFSLLVVTFFVAALTMSAQYADQQDSSGVPAYNKLPPAKGASQPPILKKEQLWGENGGPTQIHAYELAAKIPSTLHQLPCFCHCDRMGHKSLRTCFEGTHGAQCDICMKEVFYAYGEKQKGKTVAQIRKAIVEGQWKNVTPEQAEALR
jgi:hypothetical protein